MTENSTVGKKKSALNLVFYSHATLECRDIAATRRFFEEFLGFETVQMSKGSFWSRLGGETVIVVVQGAKTKVGMPILNHNGLDVATDADVDEAHRIVSSEAEKWGISNITPARVIHGTYGFYFYDADDNAWEITCNPKGGYSWGFERGDQEGLGHMSRKFVRPPSTLVKNE